MREAVSVGPPAGNGTTSLIILLGQAWACAGAVPSRPMAETAAVAASTARREKGGGEKGWFVHGENVLSFSGL